ncbi:MAG: SAM-dependent methyltransferase, partial [Desulfovibrio sp.]
MDQAQASETTAMAGRGVTWAVFLLSGGAIGFEILLMRLLSVALGQYFAALVISLALLGIGAGGSLLALARSWAIRRVRLVFPLLACGFGLAALAMTSLALARAVDFTPQALVWDPSRFQTLVAIYCFLALPFVFSGAGIGLALSAFPRHIARIYRADLVGAGLGAPLMLAAFMWAKPEACMPWVLLVGMAAGAVYLLGQAGPRNTRAGLAVLGLGVTLALLTPVHWATPVPGQYRPLAKALLLPGARITAERSGPMGWVAVVESDIPIRHAPGMSLNSPYDLPDQAAIFRDGGSLGVITRDTGSAEDLAFLDALPTALPYALRPGAEVLVLDAGGGFAVMEALHHGAAHVTAVEPDSRILDMVTAEYAEFSGNVYTRSQVTTEIAHGRAFLEQSKGGFGLIMLRG